MRYLIGILFAAMAFIPCASADSITITSETYQSGTGFGHIPNLLTLQANTTEEGSVEPPGSTLHGDAKNTSRTYTVAQLESLGLNANNFALVFNISETGAGGDTVVLNKFSLDFYDSGRSLLGRLDDLTNPDESWASVSGSGSGTAGYIMRINQGAGGASLSAFFLNPDNILGASALLTESWNGQENFYLIRYEGDEPMPTIPEPATLLLFGTGLTLLGLKVNRRKRK